MDDKDLPILNQKSYVKLTAIAWWEVLPTVVLAGLLLALVSLPAGLILEFYYSGPAILIGVLTVAPGWVATCALIARALLRESHSAVDFFKDFAHFYGRGVRMGLLFGLPLVSAAWLLPSLQITPVPTGVWIGLCADAAGLFFLTALSIYVYPQIVLYNVGVRVALKNSFILTARYLSNTLGLLAMAFLLTLLAVKVSYFLLLIFPASWLVFVINNCRMVVRIELGEPDQPESNENLE
jgi:uncharacterized membrane protein YesL